MCITPEFLIVAALLVAAVFYAIYVSAGASAGGLDKRLFSGDPATAVPPIAIQIAAGAAGGGGGGDDRYTRAPKPERVWVTEPEIPTRSELYGQIPRVATRGLPEQYQSMGVITLEDGAVLPLYGRRTTARSDRFQYYTRTDSYNPVQLPLSYKRRDCQDDVGCDELFDGETVTMAATNQKGRATIYRFNGPTYVPGIL